MGRPRLKKEGGGAYFTAPKTNLKFIRSGCALLDCALGGGYVLGRIANLVGDKSTGKTLLAIEACANFIRDYPNGDIYYCETEAAFDKDYAAALGLPLDDVHFPEGIETVEDLFEDLERTIKDRDQGKPGLYIIDSLDSLSDRAEMERGISDGTYGAAKAKKLSELFRRLVRKVEKTQMAVIVVSQVRDAIGVTFGEKYTRAGGKALDFYASQAMWLAVVETLKKTIDRVQRPVGVCVKARLKKNKVGLPFRECVFEIRFGYGIDDISSHLEWLKSIGKLDKLEMSEKQIPAFLRSLEKMDNAEVEEWRTVIDEAVRSAWYEIERSFVPTRRKYG